MSDVGHRSLPAVGHGFVSARVRGRQLEALRACALHPLGLRRGAYPSAMPVLVARGLVEELPARWRGCEPEESGWFLTEAGRALVQARDS